ncbi:MAG: S8/S53 family peptidase [Candidatus Thermoplasmatota archaeon]|nr:S8/S53 family peptidase [Candidatus Thermoplasmatota archaeon]
MDALDATDLILGGVLMVDDVRHARRSRWLGALLMVALLAGLVVGATALLGGNDGAPQAVVDGQPPSSDWRPYSVVAPIDTGINVYHDHFRTEEVYPEWLLNGLGVTKTCEPTFEGSWQERYEADKEVCWDTITTSDIVYFKGTKIIGTSPDGGTDIHILDDPSDGHGTAVTGAVLDANPDAVIFFVEGFSTEAVLAAGNQPLVDIVTTSFGAIGSLPVPGIETGTHQTVVVNNKIHTGAADNTPSPAVQDATAGPPWSIGIAGYAEEGDDQKETMSGSYPDIAADWTQVLPNHDDVDGYHETSGTSFATPRTAGILSFVLEHLRGEVGDMGSGASSENRSGLLVDGVWPEGNPNAGSEAGINNAVVRNALNLSAWYPSFSTWDPSAGTMPISPVAPCTQVGWGVVNMSNIQPMIEHLNGTQTMPDRPGDVELCMQINQEAREAYWNVYPSEESPGQTLVMASRD